jgi:hypothetical protein
VRLPSKLSSIALLFAVAIPLFAQEEWKTKPYQQWTRQDVLKIMTDSPWAQVGYAEVKATPATSEDQLRAVTIQLRSALSVRQALLRYKQLEAKYDQMNNKQRLAFDAETRELLDCPVCADKYVVALGPPQSSRPVGSGIRSLRDLTIGALQKRVYLANERGERRDLVYFKAPVQATDQAFFFFSRFDERGRTLLTLENKKLIFFFDARDLTTAYG